MNIFSKINILKSSYCDVELEDGFGDTDSSEDIFVLKNDSCMSDCTGVIDSCDGRPEKGGSICTNSDSCFCESSTEAQQEKYNRLAPWEIYNYATSSMNDAKKENFIKNDCMTKYLNKVSVMTDPEMQPPELSLLSSKINPRTSKYEWKPGEQFFDYNVDTNDVKNLLDTEREKHITLNQFDLSKDLFKELVSKGNCNF